jgi:tetratricopeptide (TPR) repeat protein
MKEAVDKANWPSPEAKIPVLLEMIEVYRERLKLDVMVVNAFNQILTLQPDNLQAVDAQALPALCQDRLDYDEAIRIEPNTNSVWSGRCWNRAVVGELQAALADCNNALQLEPNAAAAFDSRGLTYLKMGQFDSAINDYNAALRLDPKMASALYGRGLAKLKKGDITGGNADVAAATRIDSKILRILRTTACSKLSFVESPMRPRKLKNDSRRLHFSSLAFAPSRYG